MQIPRKTYANIHSTNITIYNLNGVISLDSVHSLNINIQNITAALYCKRGI